MQIAGCGSNSVFVNIWILCDTEKVDKSQTFSHIVDCATNCLDADNQRQDEE